MKGDEERLSDREIAEALSQGKRPDECLCTVQVMLGPEDSQPTYEMIQPGDDESECECESCWTSFTAKDGEYCIGVCWESRALWCKCPFGQREPSPALRSLAREVIERRAAEAKAAKVKSLPLTADVLGEVEDLNHKVWAAVNKQGLPEHDHDLVRIGYLLGEIQRFSKYGRENSCPSALYSGPGHQSRTGCELPPDHEGRHRGEGRSWKGLVAFTDFFDQEDDDDDE